MQTHSGRTEDSPWTGRGRFPECTPWHCRPQYATSGAYHCWASKAGVVKLYDTRQQIRCVPLYHSGSDAPKHRPCGLIGHADLAGQLNGRELSLALGDAIEGQKPLAQADIAVMQNRSGRDGGLTAAVDTLIQAVGQAAAMPVSAFRADKAVRLALCGQIVLAALLRSKSVHKLT